VVRSRAGWRSSAPSQFRCVTRSLPRSACTTVVSNHLVSFIVKENVRKRPLDAAGGLGRQGAVRKRKDEVHEMNGHKFVQRQFYQIILCAFCSEFLLNAAGYQCEDCRYTCHKKCYEKVVTKCISKSTTGVRTPSCHPRAVPSSGDTGTGAQILTNICFCRETKRRSTIAFLTDSSHSRTSVRIGAATAASCCPLGERTPGSAPNATLRATPTARTWCPTFAACRWRPPTSFSATGGTSIVRALRGQCPRCDNRRARRRTHPSSRARSIRCALTSRPRLFRPSKMGWPRGRFRLPKSASPQIPATSSNKWAATRRRSPLRWRQHGYHRIVFSHRHTINRRQAL
jgi:hypothetical protein